MGCMYVCLFVCHLWMYDDVCMGEGWMREKLWAVGEGSVKAEQMDKSTVTLCVPGYLVLLLLGWVLTRSLED